jgi:hypothetical protein
MTRTRLEPLLGERKRFSGIFVRKGRKRAYKGWGTLGDGYDATVLLEDIRDDQGRIVTDHLWFSNTQAFEDALMVEGEVVTFNARVDDYIKGHEKDDYDYKLSRPSKIVAHGLPEWDDYDGPSAYRNTP